MILSRILDQIKSRVNQVSLFWKVWICHILLYFSVLMLFLIIKEGNPEDNMLRDNIFLLLLKSAVIGLFGFLDGIGPLVFISVAVMYLLNLYFRKLYISYILSLALTYPVFMLFCNEGYGSNTFTVMSLAITVIINMIIFRNNIHTNPVQEDEES
ncbi:hypothetical protein ACVVIH_17030 [Chryseobacterium arthrosphaerae]|uniref:hypothetical protein n=1 Tax=Chryseobacterium arthrosphaerae TaxID=651561 RepID=UPI001BAEA439|nr:hypothetical protein [Chryseobacterium arthrosphaerae]QUY55424.1 hypothetical protein I2F65_21615 [Chryseobacterium arthrosphaerae]